MLENLVPIYQMNESGCREPNGEKHGEQLSQSDRVAGAQDVEILQYVGYVHETQNAEESQTFFTEMNQ